MGWRKVGEDISGWYGNSERHSLASKGVKTKINKLKSNGKYNEGRPFDDFLNAMLDEGFEFIDAFDERAFGYGDRKFPTFIYKGIVKFGISSTPIWLDTKGRVSTYHAEYDGRELTAFAFYVPPDKRGTGLGTEAQDKLFNVLDKTNITLYAEPNAIAIKGEKKGMKRDALIKWYLKIGWKPAYGDSYSILKFEPRGENWWGVGMEMDINIH